MFQSQNYWKRLNLQDLCNYLRLGHESDIEEGTPKERTLRHEKALRMEMLKFRDQVIAYDWNSVSDDEHKLYMATEDMWQDLLGTIECLCKLEYEMGFHAALTILLEKEITTDLRKAFSI
jgi:hypothetical protein